MPYNLLILIRLSTKRMQESKRFKTKSKLKRSSSKKSKTPKSTTMRLNLRKKWTQTSLKMSLKTNVAIVVVQERNKLRKVFVTLISHNGWSNLAIKSKNFARHQSLRELSSL